jgi:hypothetical protein
MGECNVDTAGRCGLKGSEDCDRDGCWIFSSEYRVRIEETERGLDESRGCNSDGAVAEVEYPDGACKPETIELQVVEGEVQNGAGQAMVCQ